MRNARLGKKFKGGWKLSQVSQESKIKMSLASKGKPKSAKHIKNMKKALKGIKKPKWSKERKIESSINRKGEKCYWLWKGGITPLNKLARKSIEWKLWHSDVFERDNWTCQTCGARGIYLEVHHIKSWSKFPELRYVLENGVTLCRECHKLTDNFCGRKTNKTKH